MNGKEKIYFLLDAIDDARTITPSGKPLIIDPINDLNNNYRGVELPQLFTKLVKDEQVLKVLQIPSRIKTIDIIEDLDPYEHADDGCWHIELLPAFDQYYLDAQLEPEYQEFTGKKPPIDIDIEDKPLPQYTRKALEKIWNILQEIEEKRQVGTENAPLRIPTYPTDAMGAEGTKEYEDRKAILEKLQSIEAISDLHKGSNGAYNYWAFNIGPKYQNVLSQHEDLYQKAAKDYQQTQQIEKVEPENSAYKITYSEKTREIIINNFLLANPDFDSENERVFTYIYKNPNKKISLEELQQNTGRLGKTLHKIVENLGFTGNFRKAFFDVSKTGIRFRNPITKTDLDELGIKHLKLS